MKMLAPTVLFWISAVTGAALTDGLAFSDERYNDLSPFVESELDAQVHVEEGFYQKPQFYLRVDTPFTNTIVCDVTVEIPYKGVSGRAESKLVTIERQIILPNQAFEQPLSYALADIRLPQGASPDLREPLSLPKAAKCAGWPPSQKLSKTTCKFVNPNHDQTCMELEGSGQTAYFLVKNEQYLGNCGCY